MKKIILYSLLAFTALYAVPVVAAAKAKPAASPKHDKRQPIEVTSDTLEVFQQENRAVFTGHVIAIQGDVRLKADVMTVYYRKADDKGKPGHKAEKVVATPDAGAIKKIDTSGNVFLSTPKETASGDTGTYEVEKQEIHLDQNVVLTRDKNVLKGDHLVYNFQTGRSTLVGGAESSDSKTPDGKPTGRVRALFVPNKDDKPTGKK